MGDRLRPYALVVLDECDEHDDERGWCVAEYDSGEELDRLDALRARLADLGERVAAMEDGGDDR